MTLASSLLARASLRLSRIDWRAMAELRAEIEARVAEDERRALAARAEMRERAAAWRESEMERNREEYARSRLRNSSSGVVAINGQRCVWCNELGELAECAGVMACEVCRAAREPQPRNPSHDGGILSQSGSTLDPETFGAGTPTKLALGPKAPPVPMPVGRVGADVFEVE